MGMIMTDR